MTEKVANNMLKLKVIQRSYKCQDQLEWPYHASHISYLSLKWSNEDVIKVSVKE